MEIPDDLRCLFSASVEESGGRYVIEIPDRELSDGDVRAGDVYRVAVLADASSPDDASSERTTEREADPSDPPVAEGETRTVEIESIGEQGDGIARVERGYVVIVPDSEKSERVRIRIDDVRQNVAFAEVVERVSYYD